LPRDKKYCFQIKYYLDRSLIVTNHNLQAPFYLTELLISTSLSGSLVLKAVTVIARHRAVTSDALGLGAHPRYKVF